MTSRRVSPSRSTLVIAAVVAGACAIALIALGWWFRDWEHSTDRQRFEDGGWWAGTVSHVLGYFALGKVGFKLALGAVVASLGIATWARGSRRPQAPPES